MSKDEERKYSNKKSSSSPVRGALLEGSRKNIERADL